MLAALLGSDGAPPFFALLLRERSLHPLIKPFPMIFKVLMIGLLLVYYFYFYHDYSKPVEKPRTVKPMRPLYHDEFLPDGPDQFKFESNNVLQWKHQLPDRYVYLRDPLLSNPRIVARDACFGQADHARVAAQGEPLYEYVKAHPQTQGLMQFSENDEQVVRKRSVFFFRCKDNHIDKLESCPSGTFFVKDRCQNVELCTGQPEGMLFPHLDSKKYYECQNEESHVKECEPNRFFLVKSCVSTQELAYHCRFHPHQSFLLDQDKTRVHCEHGKPVFQTCPPGKVFFDDDVCELDMCKGFPDNTRIPLPETTVAGAFQYIPGYMTCLKGKVLKQVECPRGVSSERDEHFLPMVFDETRQQCVLPQFGVNVTSTSEDILLPIKDYSLHLKNWGMAYRYDRMKGRYLDPNGQLQTKILSDGKRIGDHFQEESACESPTDKVPILGHIQKYYDCNTHQTVFCLPDEFFNGKQCMLHDVNDPAVVRYKGLPVFKFDLYLGNWIEPFKFVHPPGYSYPHAKENYPHVRLYDMWVHHDCMPYLFLRQIPDMAILLKDEKAKCFYDKVDTIIKEKFEEPYSFWDQKILADPHEKAADCVPGNRIQTGNFIWDQTIYSTCLPEQPFVFCPNPLGIIKIDNTLYACKPPDSNVVILDKPGVYHFTRHEVRRISPADSTNAAIQIQINAHPKETLPVAGIEIPHNQELELTLFSDEKVKLELKQRVTYPPNVAYEYDDQGMRTAKHDKNFTHGYIMKNEKFPPWALNFPTYTAQSYLLPLERKHLTN